jgi:hypothetical protein
VRGEIGLGLADALKVALDGVGRAVLGLQVPLEGAEQRAQGGAVNAPDDGTVMVCPSVMRPSRPAGNDDRPAFPLVSLCVEPPGGIEPPTPSLPSMRGRFTLPCSTLRVHITTELRGDGAEPKMAI